MQSNWSSGKFSDPTSTEHAAQSENYQLYTTLYVSACSNYMKANLQPTSDWSFITSALVRADTPYICIIYADALNNSTRRYFRYFSGSPKVQVTQLYVHDREPI